MGHAHDSHRPFKFPPTCGGADGRRSAGRWTITPQLSRALGTVCMGDARAHGGVPTPRAPVAAFSAGKRLGAQIFHGSGSSHLQTGRRAGSHPRRNTSPPPHPVATLLERGGGTRYVPNQNPTGLSRCPSRPRPAVGSHHLLGTHHMGHCHGERADDYTQGQSVEWARQGRWTELTRSRATARGGTGRRPTAWEYW